MRARAHVRLYSDFHEIMIYETIWNYPLYTYGTGLRAQQGIASDIDGVRVLVVSTREKTEKRNPNPLAMLEHGIE